MINKKLLIIVITIIVLIIGSFIGINIYKSSQENKKLNEVKAFTQDFIKDFSTYNYRSPDAYNKKIDSYVSKDYMDYFQAAFNLAGAKYYSKDKLKNYSVYQDSSITIERLKTSKAVYTAQVSYAAKQVSYPNKPIEFESKKSLILTIVENNKKFYINNLVFAD